MSRADPTPHSWLSRAWSTAVDLARGPTPPAVYAFGKHPAFADFVDVARLPPVPAAFRHFHDHLRPAVERDGGPAEAVLIAWADGGTSAAVWVQPSRDRGDGVTSGHRRCPLLLGVTARCPLPTLLRFAGGRLATLADDAMASGADGLLSHVARAAAEWPAAFPSVADREVPTVSAVADAAGDRSPVVVVAGPAGPVVNVASLRAVSVATLSDWVARAARPIGSHA